MNNMAINPNAVSPNCDITWMNYKEVKKSEGVVEFKSSGVNDNNKFEWTVTFENGDQKSSFVENPQFNYSPENGIASVTTKVSTAKCTRTFTKNYQANYWKFF